MSDFVLSKLTLKGAAVTLSEVSGESFGEFQDWLSRGKQAGMDYMSNWQELRRNPELLLPGAESMIVVAVPFPLHKVDPIASYALGEDYHDVIRDLFRPALKRLQDDGVGEWRLCIDSAPVMERYWAVRSGLCRRTLSGMVSTDGLGTAFFLAELLTTCSLEELSLQDKVLLSPSDFARLFGLEVEVPDIISSGLEPSDCTQCGLCEKTCPGRTLFNGQVDSRRCLSYLTIEHRGEFDTPEAREVMKTSAGKETLFGCDRCVAVCPLNYPPYRMEAEIVFLKPLLPRKEIEELTVERIAEMTPQDFSRIMKRSPIKRTKLVGLRRNAGLPPVGD